jgi:thiosulfate/3-mercaptopyruvate sulfurtransferase
MPFTTLITTRDLIAHLDDPDWVVLDCRFSLAEPDRGEQDYIEAHIPGAVYVHLDRDLSDTIVPGVTGRHPWPSVESATELLSNLGIGPGVQVVAYDDTGGGIAAVRIWWILRWLGHKSAAVLDGGWSKWAREGRPVVGGVETRSKREFMPNPRSDLIKNAKQVDDWRNDPAYLVVDSRAAERYLGDVEPIDSVAGHIPGAKNSPWMDNLAKDGTFLPKEELRQRYVALLGEIPPDRAVFYCGSGVTSIHNLLAMEYTGVGEGRLYAGSWSEWITDESRPVASSKDK